MKRRTQSADGTAITYYVLGSGPRVWLSPPAMGAPLSSMRPIYEALASECTVVTWDMRGFHGSDAPRDPRAYAVSDHVLDLEAVRSAEGLESFVLGGWSMGVPVSLEYFARASDNVRALLLINGPYESALTRAMPSKAVADAITKLVGSVGASAAQVLNPLSRSLLGARGLGKVLTRAGVIAGNGDQFERVLGEFRHVDWARYLTVMTRLDEHSARAHLDRIDVPTLVTAGTRDVMTPPSTAQRMHRMIRGSELLVVEGGTHYMPIEFPELLVERIRTFLLRHVPA